MLFAHLRPFFCIIEQDLTPFPSIGIYHLSIVNKVNPSLEKYAEAQEDALLKIRLDVGQVEMKDSKPLITGNRLGIDNLFLQLNGKEIASPKHAKLPGADGPNPQLSSGPKSLEVVNQGSYVDLTGTRHVKLEDGEIGRASCRERV